MTAIIGNYVVEHELGRGGMGIVYAARHRVLGHRAAIKVLLTSDGDQVRVERFFNEARAATAIRHPAIVTIHDVGLDAQGRPYIAMELLEGTSLAQHLAAGPLPVRVAVDYAIQIADALAAAHDVGVIHRDLKPENIIVAPDRSRVTLVDFGVAKLTHAATVRTATGALIGTPLYMSPEQCEGIRELDARSDLYALGCTLFATLTGRPPFDAPSAGALIGMHLHVAPPPLRSRAPTCSEALERLITVLLAKKPEDRFRTAAAVRAALSAPEMKGLASAAGVAATAAVPPPPMALPTPLVVPPVASSPSVPARSSRRWLAVLITGGAGLVVALIMAARSCGGTPAVVASGPRDAAAGDAAPGDAVAADAVVVALVPDSAPSRPLIVTELPKAFASLTPPDAAIPPDAARGTRSPPPRSPPDASPRQADAGSPVSVPTPAAPTPDAPPPPPDAAPRPRVAARERITFAPNDFSVSGAGDVIERVAAAYVPGGRVTIVGHAESTESQRPEGIASARANSVLTALVNKRVPRDAIETDREVHPPGADGSNRRVDIRVE